MCNVRRVQHGTTQYIVADETGGNPFTFMFDSSDRLRFYAGGGSSGGEYTSTRRFRDTEWMSVGVAYDSVARTIKMVVNDQEIDEWTQSTAPNANFQTSLGYTGARMAIGAYNNAAGSLEANVSDFVILDGEVLTPQEMINYRTQLVGNNVTTKKFTTEGKASRWLGLHRNDPASGTTIIRDEGQYVERSTASWDSIHSDILPSAGKFHIEAKYNGDTEYFYSGLAPADHTGITAAPIRAQGNFTGTDIHSSGHPTYGNGADTGEGTTAWGVASAYEIVDYYFDMATRKFYMSVDGVFLPGMDPVAGTGGYDIVAGDVRYYISLNGMTSGIRINFGQKDYAYPVAGYGPLKEPAESDLKRCKLLPSNESVVVLNDRAMRPSHSSASWQPANANFFLKGKMYAEVTLHAANDMTWGVSARTLLAGEAGTSDVVEGTHGNRIMYSAGSQVYLYGQVDDSRTQHGAGVSGAVYGVAVDMDARKVWFHQNGTWLNGDPTTGVSTNADLLPALDYQFICSMYSTAGITWNFGDSAFSYTPPTGFVGPASVDFDTLRRTAPTNIESVALTDINNLTVTYTAAAFFGFNSDYYMNEGVYYCEATLNDTVQTMIGIFGPKARAHGQNVQTATDWYGIYDATASHYNVYTGGGTSVTSTDPALVDQPDGTVIGMLLDIPRSKLFFRTPAGWYGDPVAGTGGIDIEPNQVWAFAGILYQSNTTMNFGATAFTYSDQGVVYKELNAQTAMQQELEYGPNGCQLLFEDSSSLGKVTAGNLLPWTLTGITSDDQLTDTPGDALSIWSTLDTYSGPSITDGGRKLNLLGAGDSCRATQRITEGKYYVELDVISGVGDGNMGFGVSEAGSPYQNIVNMASVPAGVWILRDDGYLINNGVGVGGFTNYITGKVALAVEAKGGGLFDVWYGMISGSTITWEGTGNPSTGANPQYADLSAPNGLNIFGTSAAGTASTTSLTLRCDESEWVATNLPAGFKELKTSNKETPKYHGRDKVDVIQYLGDSTTKRFYTSANMKNGVYMSKGISTTYNFKLWTTLSTMGPTNELRPNDLVNMSADANGINAFHDDGYTGGPGGSINNTGITYNTWMFGLDGDEVINNEGSIQTKVIADSSGYMNILSWEGDNSSGATVGTGMDDCELFIAKSMDNGTYSWHTWHKGLTDNYYQAFDNNGAQDNSVNIFPAAGRTNRLMQLATSAIKYNNLLNQTYFGWALKSVPGLLSIQEVKGNGSADGWFMQTDFLTRLVWVFRIDAAGSKNLLDTELDNNGNPMREQLAIDTNATVTTAGGDRLDIDAEGIKCRTSGVAYNANGGRYLVVAWAKASGGGALPGLLGN